VHGHAQPDQVPAIAAPIPQWSGGESLTHSPPPPAPPPPLRSIESLWAATEAFALTGQIDRTANINSSRVWLFTGKKDLVVNSGS